MKLKLLFSMLAMFLMTSSPVFASFPVEKVTTNETTTTVKEQKEVLTSPAAAAGSKSQLVALILCWAVGIIGIHRFYLGYTWQGIVQIITLGGLGIWTLIDFIRILVGTLKPKDGEYDKTL
ncbi:MAG: TM2 domain-containing membrane protein YozV [Flavobacterium sp.]|jgi:TM2 domain-containing membrane protein YozV